MNVRMKNQAYGTIRKTRKVRFVLYGVQIISFIAQKPLMFLSCPRLFINLSTVTLRPYFPTLGYSPTNKANSRLKTQTIFASSHVSALLICMLNLRTYIDFWAVFEP